MFIQEALPSSISYHIPIILRPFFMPAGPCPFKFELMSLEISGFVEMAKGWWKECVVEGSASYKFAQKLKLMKDKIVKWKKEEIGGIESRKLSCLQKIESLKERNMERGLEEEEKAKMMENEKDYHKILRMEEISWLQKSKVSWLKEGDKNTKLFHKTACWREANNYMSHLKVDGEWIYDQVRIREAVEQFYSNLYIDLFPIRLELEGVAFDRMDEN